MNRSFFTVAFLLCALLSFCAGCGGSGGFEGRTDQNNPTPTPAPTPPPNFSGPPAPPF